MNLELATDDDIVDVLRRYEVLRRRGLLVDDAREHDPARLRHHADELRDTLDQDGAHRDRIRDARLRDNPDGSGRGSRLPLVCSLSTREPDTSKTKLIHNGHQ